VSRKAWHYEGDLRRDLLDRAAEHSAADGPATVSLRAIARDLGVSHAAPATYFADKRALLTALAQEGLEQLGEAFGRSWQETAGRPASERMAAMGRAYAAWAFANPGHYAVMWQAGLVDHESAETVARSNALHEGFVGMIEEAQAEGWAAGVPAADVAMTLWSTVHGLVALLSTMRAPESEDRGPGELVDTVTELVARSLAAL
jgi:AcrR family transcriptional regulator